MMTIKLTITLDQIQITLLMMIDDHEYIIPDDYGPPPGDDLLDMPGIQDSG